MWRLNPRMVPSVVRGMRTFLLAGSLALVAGCGTAATTAQSSVPAVPPAAAPVAPVSSEPVGAAPPSAGPKQVKPVGGTVNPREVAWISAKPVDRGRKVKLVWWSGVEPCTVLDRVQVRQTRSRVTLTLFEGTPAKAKNTACIAIAVQKTTTVRLKAPVGRRPLVDGAKH
jgi:hypothetical protein